MKPEIAALQKSFRDGYRAEAIAGCEAALLRDPSATDLRKLCAMMHAMMGSYARSREMLLEVHARDPSDADVLFNIGMCERELNDFAAAAGSFRSYVQRFPGHADGWASLAECQFRSNQFEAALASADRALALAPASVPGWTVRGSSQKALGRFEDALASLSQAIQLAPSLAELKVRRADVFESLGDLEHAAEDYRAAISAAPGDDASLKKATTCLLQLDRGREAIELCRDVLKVRPDSLTAKLGAEWLLSQLVPLWHIPMVNEDERNLPYQEGLRSVVTPLKTVFEIGTGSGLLAMMAARLGAREVITCEAVDLVADVAKQIVEKNGLAGRVRVLGKPSYAVEVGSDLPRQADVLLHEVFSSELLGEHVLPAIEDAKARLLKPGGEVLPSSGSIMIALVGGDELGTELHVGRPFGFDLSPFNAISPKKRPIHREDLPRVLLSAGVEAFRFDFAGQSSFPPERKQIDMTVTNGGLCYGIIQWIRFEFGAGIFFENDPSRRRPVASWQHTIYRFDEPRQVEKGTVVTVDAMHDRSRPWFELAADAEVQRST